MSKQLDVNKVVNALRSRISDLEYELMIRNLLLEETIEELNALKGKEVEDDKADDVK